jgi:hypothetical protein
MNFGQSQAQQVRQNQLQAEQARQEQQQARQNQLQGQSQAQQARQSQQQSLLQFQEYQARTRQRQLEQSQLIQYRSQIESITKDPGTLPSSRFSPLGRSGTSIGKRGTQNLSVVGSLICNSVTSGRIISGEYQGRANQDIAWYTFLDKNISATNPSGISEQMRIDNSGNMGFFGTTISEVFRDIKDISFNFKCFNKVTEIFVSSPSAMGGSSIRITAQFANWGSNIVSVASDIICTIYNGTTATYSCVGKNAKSNLPGPNQMYFDTSTTGLTTTNGNVFLSSLTGTGGSQPYALIYRFNPTTTPMSIGTIYIKIVHSATASQIQSLKIDILP